MEQSRTIICGLADENECCRSAGRSCTLVVSRLCKFMREAYKLGKQDEIERIGADMIKINAEVQQAQLEELRKLVNTAQMQAAPANQPRFGYWEYGSWKDGHWVEGNDRCRCSVCGRDFAVDNQNIWRGCPHCLAINEQERPTND